MITLRNITLRRGTSVLLQDIDWTIYHKQRIGIIGENGTGKSSLFAMLLGNLQPDGGELEIPRQLSLAHVAQETPAVSKNILEFVLDGDAELRALEQELQHAEQENDGERIATLHGRLGEIDAYMAPARAAQLLDGLGFGHQEHQRPVSAFSGGWRMRLNLAQALMCRSDVLLLDEPTNHLDLDAVLWLENWLLRYPGTLLLISHDRDFLDRVVDHVAHLIHQQLKLYTGNYSAFEKMRAANALTEQAAFIKQQKQIAHLQAFVNRFSAGTRARQAQSRAKALERMEVINAAHLDSPFQFAFKEPTKCPNPLIRLEDAEISYGKKIILKDLNFSIAPTDRIALLGPNGAGKSSLVKLLAGELSITQGDRSTGPGLKIGYFAQHQIDHLHLHESPFDHMRKLAPKAGEQELRDFLGGFGFSGDRAFSIVKNFSGGEKSRLALALLVWQAPNLLLLDEPTNHLDLEMRHALSMALQAYQGAMILVSHDRFLVRSTVDQLMLVAEGKLQIFDGDLSDYEKWLFEFRRQNNKANSASANVANESPVVSSKSQRQQDALARERRRPLLQRAKKLESDLDKLQKEAVAVEILLADTALYEDKNKAQLQRHLLHQADIQKKLQAVEQEWLQVHEELEAEI